MPIYEYKCPQGHVFELFQRMSDPAAQVCEVCGEAPVEKLLYPVAVHFKGSGFYSTDYGRGSRKRDASRDGDGSSSGDSGGDSGGKSGSDAKPAEKKTPAAD